ncbi:MAG TPA: hypothetical protein VMH83_15155 [Candidatus Acidoferrum sp.]|nr:hypothetical protein [Candidatus Acidoferrum sp.]
MNNNTLITSSLAVVLGLGSIWLYVQKSGIEADLAASQASHDKLLKDDQEEFDRLNKNIARLERELSDAQSRANLSKAEALGNEPAGGQQNKPQAAAASGTPLQNFVRQRLNTPEMQNTLAQLGYSQRYGNFISTLKLPPDKEQALKQRIMDIIGKQLALQQRVASGEITREQATSAAAESEKEITAAMADYLSADQMDAFKAYDAGRQTRAISQVQNTFSMQLATQAPGLTEQNRSIVAAAIATAMTSNAANAGRNGQTGTQNILGRSFEQAEQSLQGKLDDDQMQIARDFLRQQSKLINALTQ